MFVSDISFSTHLESVKFFIYVSKITWCYLQFSPSGNDVAQLNTSGGMFKIHTIVFEKKNVMGKHVQIHTMLSEFNYSLISKFPSLRAVNKKLNHMEILLLNIMAEKSPKFHLLLPWTQKCKTAKYSYWINSI